MTTHPAEKNKLPELELQDKLAPDNAVSPRHLSSAIRFVLAMAASLLHCKFNAGCASQEKEIHFKVDFLIF
jgi:hypothetical protein